MSPCGVSGESSWKIPVSMPSSSVYATGDCEPIKDKCDDAHCQMTSWQKCDWGIDKLELQGNAFAMYCTPLKKKKKKAHRLERCLHNALLFTEY